MSEDEPSEAPDDPTDGPEPTGREEAPVRERTPEAAANYPAAGDGDAATASTDGGQEATAARGDGGTAEPAPDGETVTPGPDHDGETAASASTDGDGAREQTDGESAEASADADGGPAAGGVSRATLFEVLGNERRRHVIQVLREREETVGLASLATAVAAREHGVEPDALSRRQEKTTYTALQQTHLPKMDEAGVLTFDKAAGTVTAGEAIVEYTMYLDVVSASGLRGADLYLWVAAGGLGVALALWVGLPPFAWLGALTWAGLLVLAFVAVAVVQLYHHPLFPERLLG